MDGFEIYASQTSRHAHAHNDGPGAPRSFLFLQGPISGFFDRLGRALIARGHRVYRVNLHFGDCLFWRLPAVNYRGRLTEWRDFVADLLERHRITDVVLHGDRRPYHIVAAEEARARGIAVIATDLGYVRPDWLTLEYDGMTTYSRFPRDPEAIRALAAEFPEPDLAQRFYNPFLLIAGFDIAYNLALIFGRPLYPHYRYHSVCHPFLEYVGWIGSRPKKLLTAPATAAAKRDLQAAPGTFFLAPLQLQTDFQLRAHSPFDDQREAARTIVASFAASGSDRKLVFIVHPLDNGLVNWHRAIARLAEEHGVADRVMTLHGGTPPELVRNAAGMVTINSTIGLAAVYFGVPVKVLGNAVFDIAGLTCQSPLDAFWHDPRPPEPELLAPFLRALVGATQVKGGFYERSSQECAVAGFVERLEWRPYPLQPAAATEWPQRAPRAGLRKIAIVGVEGGLGVALARAAAGPGVELHLLGRAAATLAAAAEDCRQRGALVETVCAAGRGLTADAPMRAVPFDLLIVHGAWNDASGRDMLAAMDAVAVFAGPMRRRGRGHIALVKEMSSRASGDRAPVDLNEQAWLGYGASLRRRLQADGVGLTLVHSNRLDGPPAFQPRALSADRVAELALRGVRHGRRRVVVPGPILAAGRATAQAQHAIARSLSPAGEALVGVEKAPLARQSASGD